MRSEGKIWQYLEHPQWFSWLLLSGAVVFFSKAVYRLVTEGASDKTSIGVIVTCVFLVGGIVCINIGSLRQELKEAA